MWSLTKHVYQCIFRIAWSYHNHVQRDLNLTHNDECSPWAWILLLDASTMMHLIGKNVFALPIGHASQQDIKATRFGLKYCPSMDLVAVFPQITPSEELVKANEKAKATQSEDYYEEEIEIPVDVYRLNGQKVFTIMIESTNDTVHIVDLAWRADGVMIAIVTSDNVVRLVNSFSGKIVHTHSCITMPLTVQRKPDVTKSPNSKRKSTARDGGSLKRRCMPTVVNYSTHFVDAKKVNDGLATAKEERGVALDDLLNLNADVESLLKVKADLPRQLASIDIEQYLPKLATLPANGLGEEDVFSTRTSVDAIFHSSKQSTESSTTEIVVTAQSDTHIHIRIFDSFEVGDIDISQAARSLPNTQFGRIERIVTHPLSQALYLIVQEPQELHSRASRSHAKSAKGPPAHHLIRLNLEFLQHSVSSLPILATKATQLQNLIRYLQQIEAQMAREAKSAFDLPARFIRNLEEDLKEQDGEGSTFETSAYNTLLTGQVHGKFKEWLVEILGDRGVKRWDKSVSDCLDLIRRLVNENWNPAVERAGIVVSRLSGIAAADDFFGLEQHILDNLQQTIDVMAIMGEDLLKDVCTELAGFNTFMKWLKREVEMAGLEDTSEKLDEMREGSDYSETKKVMKYIANNLRNTSVKKYIHDQGSSTRVEISDEDDADFYDIFKKNRQAKEPQSISIKILTARLTQQCERMFQQAASRLREGVLVEYLCSLGTDLDTEIFAARLIWTPELPVLQVIGRSRTEEKDVVFLRKTIDPSRNTKVSRRTSTPKCDKVLDVKIVDDDNAIFLVSDHGNASIITTTFEAQPQFTMRHTFGDEHDEYTQAGLMPRRLEVNGRKNRRTLTVLDEQGRGYGVFDLDSYVGAKDGDDKLMDG